MVPHPRYQQKPLSLGSVALVMTASRSTISPDANRESRSHGLTHLPHGRRCSQRRGAKSRSPAVGIRLSAQHEASTKGPGTNPGHCSGTSASFSESSLNEGTGNKSRSPVFRNFIDSKRFEASTKGPGTNPGHHSLTIPSARTRRMPQRRDREQIPVTSIGLSRFRIDFIDSTYGAGTNAGDKRSRAACASCSCRLNEGTGNKSRSH